MKLLREQTCFNKEGAALNEHDMESSLANNKPEPDTQGEKTENTPINYIFKCMIDQMQEYPQIEKHMQIPNQAKSLVAELAMLSFTEQTYGYKGTIRILKNLEKGRTTHTYNLLDKLKDRVFFHPLDKFSLLPADRLHGDSLIKTLSPGLRKTPDYLLTSGRHSLHEKSLPHPVTQ
jgi:hypothetical protein